jgi:hypothetical protein
MTQQTEWSFQQVSDLKDNLEKLTSKDQQLHVLDLLTSSCHQVRVNENKSGVFVNLMYVPASVLGEVREYLQYLKDQEAAIMELESKQEACKHALTAKQEPPAFFVYHHS